MSLGTDLGFLMSPELLRVVERAQHDRNPEADIPAFLLRTWIRAWSSAGDVCPGGW